MVAAYSHHDHAPPGSGGAGIVRRAPRALAVYTTPNSDHSGGGTTTPNHSILLPLCLPSGRCMHAARGDVILAGGGTSTVNLSNDHGDHVTTAGRLLFLGPVLLLSIDTAPALLLLVLLVVLLRSGS